jgi:predicted MFS family arabinose efflux permease
MLGTSAILLLHKRKIPHQRPRDIIELGAFREPSWVMLSLTCFIFYVAQYLPVFYTAPWSVEHGYVPADLTYYVLPIVSPLTPMIMEAWPLRGHLG